MFVRRECHTMNGPQYNLPSGPLTTNHIHGHPSPLAPRPCIVAISGIPAVSIVPLRDHDVQESNDMETMTTATTTGWRALGLEFLHLSFGGLGHGSND